MKDTMCYSEGVLFGKPIHFCPLFLCNEYNEIPDENINSYKSKNSN